MIRYLRIPALALTALASASAQPTAFEFRAVVAPGSTIAGHRFTEDTAIAEAAINDADEVAFIATFIEDDGPHTAVFTSQRIVARQDDVIDGKYIASFPPHGGVAINRAGQVAFAAVYTESLDERGLGEIGIFVENRLAVHMPRLYGPVAFSLSDDGRVELKQQTPARQATASQQKQGLLDRIRIKPPRLPNDVPVTVAPEPSAQPHQSAPRPQLVNPLSPFEVMCVNRRGDVLIPVNLAPRGFMLLLGTPAPQASGRR
jgi:hypothetical protein